MFADYITQSGETRSAWADRIGITRSYLSEILNGKKKPSLKVAVAIERLTAGAVPAVSWEPDGLSTTTPETDAA